MKSIYLEGDADLPAHTLLLRLWPNSSEAVNADNYVELRIEGDRAYGRAAGGEWQEMDNVADSLRARE